MRKEVLIGSGLALALLLTACGSTSELSEATSASAETVPSAEETASFLDLLANPLPISFVADEAAAVTVEIDEAGGSLTTEDSDGVVYRLTIPQGALLGPESITMTPIDVAQSPLETLTVSAVRLEPDGLVLLDSATLHVERPATVTAPAAAFGSKGGGAEFHLTVASLGDSSVISVPHFSETGVLDAAELELDLIRDEYRSSSTEARAVQEIETILTRVRDADARNEALSDVFADWFSSIAGYADGSDVRPSAVESVYAEFLSAIDALETIEAEIEIGLTEIGPAVTAAAEAVQEATYRMFQEANLRCIRDRDPDQVFQMLRWGILHQVLWDMGLGPLDRAPEFGEAMDACMRFEVQFTSAAAGNQGGGSFAAQVMATVDLRFGEFGPSLFIRSGNFLSPWARDALIGVGELKSEAGTSTCNSPAEIAVALDLNLRYPGGGALSEASVTDRTLHVHFPGSVDWLCIAAQATFNVQESLWMPWFIGLELDRLSFDGVFEFPLEPGSGDVYGSYTNSAAPEEVGVDLKIELRHDPQLP